MHRVFRLTSNYRNTCGLTDKTDWTAISPSKKTWISSNEFNGTEIPPDPSSMVEIRTPLGWCRPCSLEQSQVWCQPPWWSRSFHGPGMRRAIKIVPSQCPPRCKSNKNQKCAPIPLYIRRIEYPAVGHLTPWPWLDSMTAPGLVGHQVALLWRCVTLRVRRDDKAGRQSLAGREPFALGVVQATLGAAVAGFSDFFGLKITAISGWREIKWFLQVASNASIFKW